MKALRWSSSALLVALLAGCSDGDSKSSAGSGGSGGVGGTSSSGGSGACVGGGNGKLDVSIKLPTGVPADVTFKSAAGLEQDVVSAAKIDLAAGQYSVIARRVTKQGLIVGSAYYPKPVAPFCLKAGATQPVSVEYDLEPGSQKLWFAGGVDAVHSGAIDAADLTASGDVAASVTMSGTAMNARALAFDRDGNLWVGDATGNLLMYARDTLGASRSDEPDRVLSGAALCAEVIPCGPRALAFDDADGLWVALPDRISHFPATALAATGEPAADVNLTGPDVMAPEALALDAEGSLWVANVEAGVAKFAASRLTADSAAPADVVLVGQTPEPVVSDLGSPTALAFDEAGALWVGYFGPNIVARYEPESLLESATVTPTTQLGVDVLALIESMAFDDSGNLWIGGSAGKLGRVAAAQLVAGGDPSAAAVTISSADISYAVDIAFDPPAKLSPIVR
ncbi:MAG: two-component regulator propeller domain-containing protein [Polyangiaceae bacterium]